MGVVFESVFPLNAIHKALGLGIRKAGIIRLDQLGKATCLTPVMMRGSGIGLNYGADLIRMIAKVLTACYKHVNNQPLNLGTVQDHLNTWQLLGLGNLRLPHNIHRLVGLLGALHLFEHISGPRGLDHPVGGQIRKLEVRLDDTGKEFAW